MIKMARSTKTKTKPSAPKGRVLTPDELKLAEALSKALVDKIGAQLALDAAYQEIGRLTGEINKLAFPEKYGKVNYRGVARATLVWAEARELAGFPPAPKREQLLRR
jgi:hypothetical protein